MSFFGKSKKNESAHIPFLFRFGSLPFYDSSNKRKWEVYSGA